MALFNLAAPIAHIRLYHRLTDHSPAAADRSSTRFLVHVFHQCLLLLRVSYNRYLVTDRRSLADY